MFKKRIRFDDFVSSIRWSFFEKLKVGLNMPKINEITTEEALNKVLNMPKINEITTEEALNKVLFSDDALDFADTFPSNVSFALYINDYMYELFYCMLLLELGPLDCDGIIDDKIRSIIDYKMIQNILDEIGISIKYTEGGGEGGAESCHSIFALGDKFYKIRYSYYSYRGYEIDDDAELIEVTPKIIEVVSYVEA